MDPKDQVVQALMNYRQKPYEHTYSGPANTPNHLKKWWDKVKTGEMAREGLLGMIQNPEQTAMDWVSPLGKVAGMIGATAYHGSPYKFDKFRLDRIGTGEGAQAYGHGLYFAENPTVASEYKIAGEQKLLENRFRSKSEIETANKYVQKYQDMLSGKIQRPTDKYGNPVADDWIKKQLLDEQKYIDEASRWMDKTSPSVYKVDIPDEAVNKMLDWDKQLPKKHRNLAWDLPPNATGKDLYEYLRKTMNNQQITEALKEAGIPGIKYLDQGSRGSGKGTYNFVVFDENLPKILERK